MGLDSTQDFLWLNIPPHNFNFPPTNNAKYVATRATDGSYNIHNSQFVMRFTSPTHIEGLYPTMINAGGCMWSLAFTIDKVS